MATVAGVVVGGRIAAGKALDGFVVQRAALNWLWSAAAAAPTSIVDAAAASAHWWSAVEEVVEVMVAGVVAGLGGGWAAWVATDGVAVVGNAADWR